MRFMTSIYIPCGAAEGKPPEPELAAAIEKEAEQLRRAGVMLFSAGLAPSATATRVKASGGKLSVVDGPFAEAKELVGGYAVVDVRSREEAVELGRRLMQIHLDNWPGWEGSCEIRQIAEY